MKVEGHGKSITLNEYQREQLKEHLSQKYQVLFDICYFTGGRISEVLNIRWIDIVENTIVLRKQNTKTKETREIQIPFYLIKQIYKLPNLGSYVFSGRNGEGHLSRQAAHIALSNACKECGLENQFSTHGFRRTAITSLHKNNIPVKTICAISGHRSLSALQGYIDISTEEVVAALQTRW